MKKELLLIIYLLLHVKANAQQKEYLVSTDSTLLDSSLSNLHSTYSLPNFSHDSLVEINKGNKAKFGITIPINSSLTSIARLDTLKNGDFLWRCRIQSSQAKAIKIYFSEFKLTEDAVVWFYNDEKTKIYGPFFTDLEDSLRPLNFVSPTLESNYINIEFYEPADSPGSLLTIKNVAHIFISTAHRNNGEKSVNPGGSIACEENPNCSGYNAWDNIKKSVVNITMQFPTGSLYWGSGVLINWGWGSNKSKYKPYLLTAFHNLDGDDNHVLSQDEIDAIMYYEFNFGYESQCGGTIQNTLVHHETKWNAQLIVSNCETDYALLKLNESVGIPDHPSDVYLAGYDATANIPTSGACIHHPKGDFKKISIESNVFTTETIPVCGSSLIDNFWKINFDSGVAEHGSSGSPLFNESQKVVGVMKYTFADECTDVLHLDDNIIHGPNKDNGFGRLYTSWSLSGSSTGSTLGNVLTAFDATAITTETIKMSDITCHDGIKNYGESGKDCGGDCSPICATDGGDSDNDTKCTVCLDHRVYHNRHFNQDQTKRAKKSITLAGNNMSSVSNGADVNFVAGEYIEFQEFDFDGNSSATTMDVWTENCNKPVGCFDVNSRLSNSELTSTPNLMDSNPKNNKYIRIFPNPASTNLTIALTENRLSKIVITDLAGQIIYSKTCHAFELIIDVSNYPKGVYFIDINSGLNQTINKLIIY